MQRRPLEVLEQQVREPPVAARRRSRGRARDAPSRSSTSASRASSSQRWRVRGPGRGAAPWRRARPGGRSSQTRNTSKRRPPPSAPQDRAPRGDLVAVGRPRSRRARVLGAGGAGDRGGPPSQLARWRRRRSVRRRAASSTAALTRRRRRRRRARAAGLGRRRGGGLRRTAAPPAGHPGQRGARASRRWGATAATTAIGAGGLDVPVAPHRVRERQEGVARRGEATGSRAAGASVAAEPSTGQRARARPIQSAFATAAQEACRRGLRSLRADGTGAPSSPHSSPSRSPPCSRRRGAACAARRRRRRAVRARARARRHAAARRAGDLRRRPGRRTALPARQLAHRRRSSAGAALITIVGAIDDIRDLPPP